MDDQPIQNRDVYEAMDVCRPGSDDISDPVIEFLAAELAAHPELDEQYERLQRLDRKLAAAFVQVPMPLGLADRIIARLALSQMEEPPALAAPIAAQSAVAESAASVPAPPRRRSRRWLLASMGGFVTAASILVIALVSSSSTPPLTKDSLLEAARAQFADSLAHLPPGQPIGTSPSAYPLSRDIRANDVRWRWVSDFLGHQAVAYDLVGAGRTRATLFVVRATVEGIKKSPTVEPEPSAATDQRSVSAWQSNGVLYVLVVDGGSGKYRQFLETGPVT